MRERELQMLEATMDIVAEKGLEGFSMKQVSNRIGVSEALLYKYFDTKDNLLYQCFLLVNREIAGLFVGVKTPAAWNIPGRIRFVHQQWERYFRFMVGNGSRSLFYYAYRDSAYLQSILMKNNADVAHDMQPFMQLTHGVVDGKLRSGIPTDYMWLFLLESTGAFVKNAIRDNLPMEEIDVDSIWLLVSSGLKGLLK